ncbi:hypothetical protein [Streptomyces sp. MMBL 11-1]|uniref:hypothetical protein n=1 Tax=Streptomyces sp. MMBL 11-1 TaxID=3026420 RepID=UPI00235E3376|nr:hypothetical protein [Streptomyces sp. MMBL 11-1]
MSAQEVRVGLDEHELLGRGVGEGEAGESAWEQGSVLDSYPFLARSAGSHQKAWSGDSPGLVERGC